MTQAIQQCLKQNGEHPGFSYEHDDRLPDVINGDLEMLTLAVQTLVEFALVYSKGDPKVTMRSVFDNMSGDEKTYLVSFQLLLQLNPKYDQAQIAQVLKTEAPVRQKARRLARTPTTTI